MTPLEIVLVVIAGTIALIAALYAIVLNVFKEKKEKQFAVLNRAAEPAQIALFGDSLTDFYPTELLIDAPLFVYNRGIAGDKIKDLLRRMTDLVDLKPRVVALLIGVNDLIGGATAARTLRRVIEVIEQIRRALPESKLIVESLYPIHRKNAYSLLCCAFCTNKKITAVNCGLKAYCEENGLEYVDLHARLCDERGRLEKGLTVEGLHLNVKGYLAVTDLLLPRLKAACEEDEE